MGAPSYHVFFGVPCQARQVSGQLEVEIRDNKALRERVHALVEEIDMRYVVCVLYWTSLQLYTT